MKFFYKQSSEVNFLTSPFIKLFVSIKFIFKINLFKAIICMLLPLTILGCGQKGPLYLPAETPEEAQASLKGKQINKC